MITQVVRMWTEEPLEAFSVAKEPNSCVLFCFKSEHPRGKRKREVSSGTNCVRPILWCASWEYCLRGAPDSVITPFQGWQGGCRGSDLTDIVSAGELLSPGALTALLSSFSPSGSRRGSGFLHECLFTPGLQDVQANTCSAFPPILKHTKHNMEKPRPRRHLRSAWPH